MNVFRKIAQSQERSRLLREAEMEYYEALNELRYRRSKTGRKLHDEESILEQYKLAVALWEAIYEKFGKRLDPPAAS